MLAQSSERSKIKKKVSPLFCLPAPFPTAPIFLCILPKGSHAHSHTFIYIRIPGYMCLPPPDHLGSFCQYICLHSMENDSVSYNCVLGRKIKKKKPFVIPVNSFCWEQLVKNTIPEAQGTRPPGNWYTVSWAVWSGSSTWIIVGEWALDPIRAVKSICNHPADKANGKLPLKRDCLQINTISAKLPLYE